MSDVLTELKMQVLNEQNKILRKQIAELTTRVQALEKLAPKEKEPEKPESVPETWKETFQQDIAEQMEQAFGVKPQTTTSKDSATVYVVRARDDCTCGICQMRRKMTGESEPEVPEAKAEKNNEEQ